MTERNPYRCWLLTMAIVAWSMLGCTPTNDPDKGILAGLTPSRAARITDAEVITDGNVLAEGRPWDYAPSARFTSKSGSVQYDLGEPTPIGAAWVVADHNDSFELQVSNDGRLFETLWTIPETDGFGFRSRFNGSLDAEARYVRVRPKAGDDLYAISELRVYREPKAEPPVVPRMAGYVPARTLRSKTLLFGLALVAWLLLAVARSRWWWKLATAALPIYVGVELLNQLILDWPAGSREVSLVRGTVALVAAFAVGLDALVTRVRPSRAVLCTVLGVCGITAFMAFYNLGHPQFYNQKKHDHTYAHYLDLRQYYTTAKYFDEIGYSGIYAADMAAYLEGKDEASVARLGAKPMRDLHTLRLSTVAAQEAAIAEAPSWFSPERWAEYKRDTGFFRETMGDHSYLVTLIDMGGNATPVWLSTAKLMFNVLEPSDEAFVMTGLLDPLLILIAFALIGYAFGWRTMFVCMVVFGANDFIMYGSNWGGATLRHDWMAYLAFGLCALKRERFMLGGALLAASAMIRAFPALALVGATVPVGWWLVEYWHREKRLPSIDTIATEQRGWLRIVGGAALGVLVLFGFSLIVLPADAWLVWIRKVGQLSSGTHANHISLRLLVSGWETAYRTLLERIPLFVASIVAMVALVVGGGRRATPVQGALLGLMLIPVIFYPANYYSHFVWLLPMLAVEQRGADPAVSRSGALVWITLLAMCGVQYFTVLTDDRGLHFWLASAVLFAAFSVVLLVWLARDRIDALPHRPFGVTNA
ncbi:MAG: discoidin domain-containing protein [Myxococcota bacterium]